MSDIVHFQELKQETKFIKLWDNNNPNSINRWKTSHIFMIVFSIPNNLIKIHYWPFFSSSIFRIVESVLVSDSVGLSGKKQNKFFGRLFSECSFCVYYMIFWDFLFTVIWILLEIKIEVFFCGFNEMETFNGIITNGDSDCFFNPCCELMEENDVERCFWPHSPNSIEGKNFYN